MPSTTAATGTYPKLPRGCPLMSGIDGLGTAGVEVRPSQAKTPGSSGVREEATREGHTKMGGF